MSYTTDDFTETLHRAQQENSIYKKDIKHVVAAWGSGSGMGTDAGHYKWAVEGASDWSGGFLLAMVDGSYVYVTGWCDYTGWGCQDGCSVYKYENKPDLDALGKLDSYDRGITAQEWDIDPIDLNRSLSVSTE